MSEYRNFRPRFHFTAKYGWLNDPNGLIFHNGIWHLYFQHNPSDTIWGPMHWGHAVSRDLMHWEEQPIALKPEGDLYIFSGSMVFDAKNSSGLAKTAEDGSLIPPLAAFFTSHLVTKHLESQSLALSYDEGQTFTFYPGNPVIETPFRDGVLLSDFRDPKVFWDGEREHWVMSLAAKDRAAFYSSDDLLHWTQTGEFAHGFREITNVWACTDLIPFDTEEGRKWVLLASMENQEGHPEPRTMYFTGSFDGKCFRPEEKRTEPLWLDFGWDNYAGVSFNDTGERRLMICWGMNPRYANQVPTADSGFRGCMTFPREMALRKTPAGWRLVLTPVGCGELFASGLRETAEAGCRVPVSETSLLKISGTKGCIRLFNEDGEAFTAELDPDTVTIDRSRAGLSDFHPDFGTEAFSRRSTERAVPAGSPSEITLIYDVSTIEVYADGGLETATVSVFPKKPYAFAECGGDLKLEVTRIVQE